MAWLVSLPAVLKIREEGKFTVITPAFHSLNYFGDSRSPTGKQYLKKRKSLQTWYLQGFSIFFLLVSGPDGTRTRDLRRDRAAF
jgi:hypothetical protein